MQHSMDGWKLLATAKCILHPPSLPEISLRYTPMHTACHFMVPRTLIQIERVGMKKLDGRSHESKLLLALVKKNEILFVYLFTSAKSSYDSWLRFLSSHSNSFHHHLRGCREWQNHVSHAWWYTRLSWQLKLQHRRRRRTKYCRRIADLIVVIIAL